MALGERVVGCKRLSMGLTFIYRLLVRPVSCWLWCAGLPGWSRWVSTPPAGP